MRRILDWLALTRFRIARRLLNGTGFIPVETAQLQRAGQEMRTGLAIDAGRGAMRRHFQAAQRALLGSVLAGVE